MNYDNPRGANDRREHSKPSRYSSLDDLRFDHQIEQHQAHIAGWRRNMRALALIAAALLVIFVLRTFF